MKHLLPLLLIALPVLAAERLPRDHLLLYHEADGKVSTAATPEEWALRRAEVLQGMAAVMGPLPGDAMRSPLNVQVDEEKDCGTYIRKLIRYSPEPGGSVP
ncbi:MAG: Alpha/beta hydrolase family protein, partial [Verrucomicrobiaceae bacterium]|nr:Alpha/beta hydrolase family protein [Verrucomicrobiaceae bacterium]